MLVVRPDLLTAEFAVREVRPTSAAALEAAQASAATVTSTLAHATGNTSTTKLRGMSIAKVIRNKQPVGVVVTVDGALEVPLPKELDFWGRQRLYVAVLEATAWLAESIHTPEEPLSAVRFENLQPGLKDPEAFRAELTDRWVARARAFAIGGAIKGRAALAGRLHPARRGHAVAAVARGGDVAAGGDVSAGYARGGARAVRSPRFGR